ncbi:glycosyltransferase, exosortase A system-associated [Gammaproteobacteria bacterium 50_400_T64]|nr:glycosyltransferase, exosortase A system-associated [Gammaproteobacteria bacterium 50_400_T64]
MKILHILDHSIPLHSGYTFRTRAILEQQRAMGWETYHLTSAKHQGATQDIEEVDGFQFYRTREKMGLLSRLPFLNQLAIVRSLEKRIDQVIKEIKPDVLHAHSPALNGLAAVRAGRRNNIPVVYECRAFWEDAAVDHGTSNEGGLRYRLTKAMESYVFRHADAVTTICQGLRNDIISRGIPAEKVTVIANAVDIERFSFGLKADPALRKELGLEGKKVLGFIGSFYAYEGLPLLLDAMPKMLQYSADIRLLLVGGGPQEALIKRKVKELGLEQEVVFTGRVPHDQVQAYYNQVEIFVYPRLAMRLTELVTPLKPLEAMAQGRLVVASDVGGHKELIRDRENGCLFKAGDAEDLADTVVGLLSTESNWPDLKRAGREYVETERNWQVSVANYQSVYPGLVSGN